LDSSYSRLLDHPWLKDVKIFHNWGNNIIMIKGIATIKTILVIKKFKTPIKQPKIFIIVKVWGSILYIYNLCACLEG
jgi:hypothetical protein